MTLDEFQKTTNWSPLEAELIRCAPLGKTAVLPGKGDCPQDTTDPDRRVRAALIRFLLLGGGEGCKTHAKGVLLRGAWVDDELDFEGEKTRLACKLPNCLFPFPVIFMDAELRGLYLPGSDVRQELDLHRLKTETDVHLRNGFKAQGPVDLCSAQIGGLLDCSGGRFRNVGGIALNCNGAVIGAYVVLRPGKDKDGNTLNCRVEGAVDFTRATIRGVLQINNSRLSGRVDLGLAEIGILADDKSSWAEVTELHLNGLTYDQIDSAMTVGQRLDWLARKEERDMPFAHPAGSEAMPWLSLGRSFDPQPYTQFARVLAAAGNRSGAARVRCARETLISRAEYRRSLARLDGTWSAGFLSLGGAVRRRWDSLFGLTFGHGHRPARALFSVFGIITLAALLYGHVFNLGQMAPNSAVILTSADWQTALKQGGNPLPQWLASETAKDYETFSAFLYAVDLFLPLDAIGQEGAWAPSHDRGWWGTIGYWARLPIQLSGWVIAAMAAAVVTGLVGRSDDGRK